MPADYAIDVHGLVKRFGKKTAVAGVDIQMPRGEVWGFLGPNGADSRLHVGGGKMCV